MTDTAPPARKGCFKRGCFGCLGVLGIGLVLVMVMALITLIRGKPQVVHESDQLTHQVPKGNWAEPDTGEPLIVGEAEAGRVVLDVSMATFSIIPAPEGTPIRLNANYNSGQYELEETFSPSGELGWTYRLSFGRRSIFDFIHIDPDNRLELYLPAGTPIVLEGKVGVGESNLELGGLWIDRVDLDVGIGDHEIDFDEPLVAPMKSFDVRGSIGELTIGSLGNASPASVDVGHSIGEVSVSLAGAWQNDSTVSVRSRIGECRIRVPDHGIGLDWKGAIVMLGEANTRRAREREEVPDGAPVVHLEASHSLGELRLTK